jgi:hypothetical protein
VGEELRGGRAATIGASWPSPAMFRHGWDARATSRVGPSSARPSRMLFGPTARTNAIRPYAWEGRANFPKRMDLLTKSPNGFR